MAWSYNESSRRINAHLQELGHIEILPLTREMNLDNLTERNCRRIYGAHFYTYLPEFSALAEMPLESDAAGEEYKRLIQAVHLYQREVSHIVENIFDAKRIHFQGIKLHGLIYRPIDQAQTIASHAVLMQWVLNDFVTVNFNPAFPRLPQVSMMAGADMGHAIGTRNGETTDRELLFLGSPANHAAKIMQPGLLRVAARLYDNLPDDLKSWCRSDNDGNYHLLVPSNATLGEYLAEYGIEWGREASRQRLEDGRRQFPLCDIEYSDAREKINFDKLSIRNNKRILAVSLFADVTNFTAFVDAAEEMHAQQNALRLFHIIRREMARVVRRDYEGVRVQFQGDRVQGMFHMPPDEAASFTSESVLAAGGLQSSLELVIKKIFPEATPLQLAIGCELGVTLASQLGTRGHRDRICLGRAVETAAQREEKLDGGQTGISRAMYQLLPKALRDVFQWNDGKGCYIASNPTAGDLKARLEAQALDSGTRARVDTSAAGARVTIAATAAGRTVPVASSYAPAGMVGLICARS